MNHLACHDVFGVVIEKKIVADFALKTMRNSCGLAANAVLAFNRMQKASVFVESRSKRSQHIVAVFRVSRLKVFGFALDQ